jgi:hypothetical protein
MVTGISDSVSDFWPQCCGIDPYPDSIGIQLGLWVGILIRSMKENDPKKEFDKENHVFMIWDVLTGGLEVSGD